MLSFRLSCKHIIAVLCCVSVIACSQALYVPTTETISDTDTLVALTEGRKLYIGKCGSCHNLYQPEKYTAASWARQVEEMKDEAKITDVQAHLILRYLTKS